MGSVLKGVGGLVGSVFGGIGGGAASAAGATNQYQVSNPYDPEVLKQALAQQQSIYGGQQNLAQALQAQMAGQGPNPAQTQYLANVGNNIANTQGLIASQRGLNPALAARLGAKVSADQNQKATLGAALLQQQQQLGAQDQLAGLYNSMNQANLGQQQLYTKGSLDSQNIGAGIADTNAKIRAQTTGGLLNAAGGIGSALITGKKAAEGGRIDGVAETQGDSPKNDTVHAMLSPGEIVIPRSKAGSAEKAKEFIDQLMKTEKKQGVTYADVLKARKKKVNPNLMYDGGAVPSAEFDDTAEGVASKAWGDILKYGIGDTAPPLGEDQIQPSFDLLDVIPPEKIAATGLSAAKLAAAKLGGAQGIAPALAAAAIRKTPTGKILGTVEQSALESGEKAVQQNLKQQALDQGLIESKRVKQPFNPIQNQSSLGQYADIVPNQKTQNRIDINGARESVKARFGDTIPNEKWMALDQTAKKVNSPYVPIVVKGKHAGFYPNTDVQPNGVIGNPKDFSDPKNIFKKDSLGWFDTKYKVTKDLIQKHADQNMPVSITTASDLISHDDYLNVIPNGSTVNIVLPHPLETAGKDFNEHYADRVAFKTLSLPSNKRLLISYDKLKKSGINANVFVPDPKTKSIKELDPFTVKKLMNLENAFWSPKEALTNE